MTISPFEERYATEMNTVFDEENKLRRWMDVEIALAHVHAELGNIPKDAAKKIENAAAKVKLSRVKEIEQEIHHDLMAMVKALSEQAGDAGKYVHLGATSYDIEDTALALIFKDAIAIIEKNLQQLSSVLKHLAKKHKKTICVGRTHGQHAVPTTYGMKFALYYQEAKRNLERLNEIKKRVLVGKMNGAVGTMATFSKHGMEIQNTVMKRLGIAADRITNQVVQRDRHAELISNIALIAAMLEKIAKEIRNLQRTEIAEIAEPFSSKQVGSSTMPHKRNPHKSERVCSLARVVRANVAIAMENIALEHERDLTNSANERIVFSESFIACDYMLVEMKKILEGLEFFEDNIERNLELTKGAIMAERLMIVLTNAGMGRQDAHEFVRKLAIEAKDKNKHLKDVAKEKIKQLSKNNQINEKELDDVFNYATYVGEAEKIVDDAIDD